MGRCSHGRARFDLSVAGYVLNSSLSAYTYDSLHGRPGRLHAAARPKPTPSARPCRATAARLLKGLLEEALKKDGSWDAYADIDLPLVGCSPSWSAWAPPSTAERLRR
ncbi:MAG: hypothetical protein ACLTDR_07570 [Adlercreutzia equolifaciens]